MNHYVQYSINIAMEATMLLVLVVLLVTLIREKKIFSTTIPLIHLVSLVILDLATQVVAWFMLINNVLVQYGAMPMRIIYILDYFFSYGATVAFYYYIEAIAIEGYKQIGVTYKPKNTIKPVIILWGLLNGCVYAALLFNPSIYRVEEGTYVFSIPAFIWLHISMKFACICAIAFIIRHRKVFDKSQAILSFVFLAVLTILLIVDEWYDTSVGSVILALILFVLYFRIDLYNGLRIERQEKDLVELRTQIMLSQMQPHFLYNVLTTISSLCEMQNATEARDVVNRFADYFRTNLDSLGKDKIISFKKELEHIKTYLWLEKVRFEDHLNIVYDIGTDDFDVPSLAVQPMVENAVKHGILQKEGPGTVTIKTYDTDMDYVIEIADDGVGFDVNEAWDDSHAHVGIENVSKRLEIICNGTCDIHSEIGVGTVVTIHIPKGDQL